ncbi:MAG: outer membrane lipoprotein carrier protein LolA [Paludibacteraceae bacterium]|nr:outer membrane lipoprotein carrier protein LolA [Paludibacteraceae bacterium]
MKKILVIAATMLASLSFSVMQAATPVSDVEGLKAKMQASAEKITSIQSDFTQEKYVSVMASTMKSSGKFYYQKTDKVKLEYTVPFKQDLVMNGTKLMMKANGGKPMIMDAASNPMMAELKKVISACMSGNIANIGDNYKMTYFVDGSNYLIEIVPQSADIKKFAEKVDLYLDSSDFTVVRMRMIEAKKPNQSKNDYTDYTFTNKKKNAAIAESVFAIK